MFRLNKFVVLPSLVLLLLIPSVSSAAPSGAKEIFGLTSVVPLGNSGGSANGGSLEFYQECKKLATTVQSQPNDYYININGKEFKVGHTNVVKTVSLDNKEEYNISFFKSENKNDVKEVFNVLCSEKTNSLLFLYNGISLGNWSEVATIERYFYVYSQGKNLKKIESSGTFVQHANSTGGLGGYTYTAPWKTEYNDLDKKLVLVSESENSELKSTISKHSFSGLADYNQCINSKKPFCIKKVGDSLIMFIFSGIGSKKVDFWVDEALININKEVVSSNEDEILDIVAEGEYRNADYWGGSTVENEYAYNQCIKFIDSLKNKSLDYTVFVNDGEFDVKSYLVLDTPQVDSNGVKTAGYTINLNTAKSLKDLNNFVSMSCRKDTHGVSFTYLGEDLGVTDLNSSTNFKRLTVVASKNNLKKVATKGSFKQATSGEWGGYVYTTPWKSSFNNLGKKLVTVSELRYDDKSTAVSQYEIGGFPNYNKCLKSEKPYCLKKVGNKLVMFARVGHGSKLINFWVK